MNVLQVIFASSMLLIGFLAFIGILLYLVLKASDMDDNNGGPFKI